MPRRRLRFKLVRFGPESAAFHGARMPPNWTARSIFAVILGGGSAGVAIRVVNLQVYL